MNDPAFLLVSNATVCEKGERIVSRGERTQAVITNWHNT